MEKGSIIVLSSIAIAVIPAQVITFSHNTSTKAIGAQCDKTRKICQIKRVTTYFGYFPAYSYYYVPLPLFGTVYPRSIISNPNLCDNCLTKITPQDEQQVLSSQAPVPQLDLRSSSPLPSTLSEQSWFIRIWKSWSNLKKCWKGFIIAKDQGNEEKMRYYVKGIMKFQKQLGREIRIFPDLSLWKIEDTNDYVEEMKNELESGNNENQNEPYGYESEAQRVWRERMERYY